MVELMVTVVIVGTCLVMALRVFTISAAAVSEAYNNTMALNILQDKMDKLQEKAVLEDGLEVSLLTEDVIVNNRKLTFTQEIAEWEKEIEEETSEFEEEESTDLCEVTLGIGWKAAGKPRSLTVKTLFPAKGFRHEF